MVVGYCDKQPVDAEDQRRIDDSFLELVLPFSTDPTLRDSWLRSDGQSIRFGKLFELLDALAADVCYHHAGCESYTSENERYLVTASVDGVTASARIDPAKDLTLQAFLTYVGKSSMECTIDFISGGKQVGLRRGKRTPRCSTPHACPRPGRQHAIHHGVPVQKRRRRQGPRPRHPLGRPGVYYHLPEATRLDNTHTDKPCPVRPGRAGQVRPRAAAHGGPAHEGAGVTAQAAAQRRRGAVRRHGPARSAS